MNTTKRKLRYMASVDGTRASWTAERDEFLVAALQAQVLKGKRSDSGFKKEAWAEVTSAINLRFVTMYHTSKIKSRLDCLKRDYKDVKYLRDNSGFGWNSELQLPTAPDDVWASVIKVDILMIHVQSNLSQANPNCKRFRSAPFPLFETLAMLLEGSYADGRFAFMPPGVLEPDMDVTVEETGTTLPIPQSVFAPPSELVQDDEDSDASSNDPTPPPKKQKQMRKRDKRSAGAVIGDAIAKLVEVEASKVTSQPDPHARVTQAIDCLIENYGYMDGLQIAALADLMSEGFNATIFMALRGDARDAWVHKNSI
ncbi:hypothetical protein DYB36_006956 [Aphanomyces astaci]|uniref:Myb/SANT-like domain-containing protein n=1 Tax=Aphanomyces astaci TaxID=112090 RepID=A0A397AQX2_APHAT|nr:hypothetical protein DYB36_006956 [Aphanomyces astaci]